MPKKPEKNSKSKNRHAFSARHDARYYALQALYQWQIAMTSPADIEAEFAKRYQEQSFDRDYFKRLIQDIPVHVTAIDALLTPHLKRPLREVDPI